MNTVLRLSGEGSSGGVTLTVTQATRILVFPLELSPAATSFEYQTAMNQGTATKPTRTTKETTGKKRRVRNEIERDGDVVDRMSMIGFPQKNNGQGDGNTLIDPGEAQSKPAAMNLSDHLKTLETSSEPQKTKTGASNLSRRTISTQQEPKIFSRQRSG